MNITLSSFRSISTNAWNCAASSMRFENVVVTVVGTMARLELVIGNWAGAFVCVKMYKQSSYLPCAAGIRQLG